jgi:hypothetical protein
VDRLEENHGWPIAAGRARKLLLRHGDAGPGEWELSYFFNMPHGFYAVRFTGRSPDFEPSFLEHIAMTVQSYDR